LGDNEKTTLLSEEQVSEDELEKENTKNPYDNISEETELLREVKDISDELNMLKNLSEDQEDVWKQVWKDRKNQDATFTYDSPSEIKAEIEEMIKDAEFVQQAIDTLLDLKQKQANIVEAKYTRKQSDDTAVQGDTIMVFTVVTILFVSSNCLT
jgi:Mg2+ and Co2+ transporter CorA